MPATRYFDRQSSPAVRQVVNSQTSNPTGGWQLVEEIPTGRIPAGKVAIFITCQVGNFQAFGSVPATANGLVQLCVGTSNGTRSLVHQWSYPAADFSTHSALLGRRATFLLLFDEGFDENEFAAGGVWPDTAALGLYARVFYNGDTPAYGINFDVSNVEIAWAILEDIPLGERHSWVTQTPAIVPPAQVPQNPLVYAEPEWAAIDETWLTFFVVYTRPAVGPLGTESITDFSAQFVTAGGVFNGLVGYEFGGSGFGTSRCGPQSWNGPNVGNRRDTFGTFFCKRFEDSAREFRVAYTTIAAPGQETQIREQRLVSIKLDALSPVLRRRDDQVAGLGEYYGNLAVTSREVALEVGNQQLTFEPYVFANLEVEQQSTAEAFNLYLRDDSGEVYVDPPTYQRAAQNITTPNLLISSNGIGYGDPGFRYELLALKRTVPVGVHQDVRNLTMCIFHPIREPDGQAPTIPSVGDPVAIVPGAEGPTGAGTLTIPPNGQLEDAPEVTQERFEGHTAYVRTWGIWLKPRRRFALFWEPLSATDRDTVANEVRPGNIFAWTAPGGSTVVCGVVERPTITGLGAGTWRVQVAVVELTYTL